MNKEWIAGTEGQNLKFKRETLLNYGMNRWGLNKAYSVGSTSELIRVCAPKTFDEWEDFYFNNAQQKKKNGVRITRGIGTGEQDRVGVAEIARDKAYRKLADRYCFEMDQIPYNELKDKDKKQEIDNRVASEKGGLIGSAMVSDAFFPFRDGVDVGLSEGVSAVIQPGGSNNDYQSIEACNEADATMVYTGQRSFKH